MLDSIILSLTKDIWGSAYSLKQLGFFYYYLHWRDISWNLYSYATSYTTQPDYNETQRKLLGWNLSQVITKCTFNGVSCDIFNDFKWYFSPDYGNCYHFNGLPLEKEVISFVKLIFSIMWLYYSRHLNYDPIQKFLCFLGLPLSQFYTGELVITHWARSHTRPSCFSTYNYFAPGDCVTWKLIQRI